MQQMTHETLDTGLGSFRDSSPDYILAPVGLASMQDQAQKLAEYGRNGDVYIVHAAQGETVIPLEVLNANPKVKGLLYKQMRDMGLDPKEFVVGDELNSINPVTGLPEFFFKKIFRTVKKVVKKVVNVAKKIAPIALPLIAATFGFPFLGTAFKAGSFASSALAGGLGTLAQGGSFKDALKSGLIQGGIASLAGGLKSSYLGEPGGFMGGVRKSFAGMPGTPWLDPDTGQWFTGMDAKGVPYSQFSGGISEGANLAALDPVALDSVGSSNVENQLADLTANRGSMSDGEYLKKRHSIISQPGASSSLSQPASRVASATDSNPVAGQNKDLVAGGAWRDWIERLKDDASYPSVDHIPTDFSDLTTFNDQTAVGNQPSTFREKHFLKTIPNPFARQNPATAWQQSQLDKYAKEALATKAKDAPWYSSLWGGPSVTAEDVATAMGGNAETFLNQVPSSAMTKSLKLVNPNVAQKWGPTVVGGLGVAGAVGAMDPEKVKQPKERGPYVNPEWDLAREEGESDADYDARKKEHRRKYVLSDEALDPTLYTKPPYVIPPYQPYHQRRQQRRQQSMLAADGGMAAYPRRELLVEGPGTERSDDIPAMLSDGEFVWNAKSVRGADPSGRGDRYAGARNLYDMMRNFEMKS